MYCVLLLAIAVVGGHPPIDVDYAPKVRDRLLLGAYEAGLPESPIGRAPCYSSLDQMRKALEAPNPDPSIEGQVSTSPDGYLPRAGTPVVIKERVTVDFIKDGDARKTVVMKVEILDGEFRGRIFYAARFHVFRYVKP